MKSQYFDVLVVDGCDADAERTLFVLGRIHGVRCMRLTDGRQALDYVLRSGLYRSDAHQHTPALLVLETQLPRLDAFALIERIREVHPATDLPIVMFSASSNELVIDRCLERGANEYVIKPAHREAYVLRVKDIVAKWIIHHRGRAQAVSG